MSRFNKYNNRRPMSSRFLKEATGDHHTPRFFNDDIDNDWKFGDKRGYVWVGFAIEVPVTDQDLRALNEAYGTQTINGLYFIIRGEIASGGEGKLVDWLKGNRDVADLFRQHLVKRKWENDVKDYADAQANGTADLFNEPSSEMPNVKQLAGEHNSVDDTSLRDDGMVIHGNGRKGMRIAQSFTEGKTDSWYAVTFSDNDNKARMVNERSMVALCRSLLEKTASEAANAETYASNEMSNISSLLAELDEYAEALAAAAEGDETALAIADQQAQERADGQAENDRPIWMDSEMGRDILKTFNPNNQTQRASLDRRIKTSAGTSKSWGYHDKGDYLVPTEYIEYRCSQIKDIMLDHICFISAGAPDSETLIGTDIDKNRQTAFGKASAELPRSILNIASFKLNGRGDMTLSIRDYWEYVAENTEGFDETMDDIEVSDPERYQRIANAINTDARDYSSKMEKWMTGHDRNGNPLAPDEDFEPIKNPENKNYLNCNRRWLGRILRESLRRELSRSMRRF